MFSHKNQPLARAARLPGERWRPTTDRSSAMLRVATPGTLEALTHRHEAFLHRLDGDQLTPVPALTAYVSVAYRRATDPPRRPFAAFELWQPADRLADLPPGKGKFRPFDAARASVQVAAMVRHAAAEAARAARWNDERINTIIHGHSPDGTEPLRGGPDVPRFAYLPLPSLESRAAAGGRRTEQCGAVRRVLVTAPVGASTDVDWVRRTLAGRELIEVGSGKPAALLAPISNQDSNLRRYVGAGAVWSTVTPVVIPGHDDGQSADTERLLRRAFLQAGISADLLDQAELEWRRGGFRPGVELATRYAWPPPVRFPRYHVRVRWPVPVEGPLAVGAGRYRGLGVFATEG